MSGAAVTADWVQLPSIGGEVRGYLALPSGSARPAGGWPCVVMAHENLGVTPHREEVTRRLAGEGFATLTVDLFSRAGGPPAEYSSPADRRIKAFLSATDDQAVPDVLAGLRFLAGVEGVDATRAGVIGFCMGGGTAIAAALLGDAFKAAVSLYALPVLLPEYATSGRPVDRIAQAPAIRCPIQFHVGEQDEVIPLDQVARLDAAARTSGLPVETYTYAGAGHAYHDDTHRNHAPEAAALTWERALAFFGTHL
jgi:carboxymethylenebutenolidase